MHNIIIFSTVLAYAVAAPAVFIDDHEYPKSSYTQNSQLVNHGSSYIHTPVYPVVHELSSAKSTLTKTSQVVNHGGTTLVHAPVYAHVPVVHELSSAKSTLTKNSHVINHGGTAVLHAPVVSVSHTPVMTVSHVPVVHELSSAKSTVTKSSQVVNHGGTSVVHAPVYTHLPIMHEVYGYEPHSVVYSSAKTGDSAISHHSSTVHETEPVVNHYPLYSVHH